MNIAIVIPESLSGRSFLQPPLGMALCKAYLRLSGHNVRLIDNRVQNLPLDILATTVKGVDLVIIPTTLYDCMQNYWVDFRYKIAVETINHLKMRLNDSKMVVCGSHATVRPDIVMEDTLADILLLGEYEKTLCLIVEAMADKKSLASVPNIVIRTKDGAISTIYDKACFHPNPDDDIFPDYTDINFENYYHDDYVHNRHVNGRKWGTILASRGCPGNCLFCYNFFGKNVRVRSPESVVKEMDFMEHKAGLNGLYFIDSTFGLDSNWVLELCDRIKGKGLTIPWNVESRCDLLTSKVLREMKSANCNRIWIGIESFDSDILVAVKKGLDENTIESFLYNTKKEGVQVGTFICFGLPEETLFSLNHTIAKIQEWGLTYTKSIIIGSPKYGTDYGVVATKQYPFIGKNFSDINVISGLVANEMRPHILKNVVRLMYDRDFIYGNKQPVVTDSGVKYM